MLAMATQNKKYLEAEKQVVEYIKNNFTNVLAIIVGGSVIRGEGDFSSDLDIYVIHSNTFRKRVYKFFNGVPCDLFINNLSHIENYFESEHKKNRPVTADIISTGKVVFGKNNPLIDELVKKSILIAEKPYLLSLEELELKKIELLTYLEDVNDVLEVAPNISKYLMHEILSKSVALFFLVEKLPLPRIKNRFRHIKSQNRELTLYIDEFYKSNNLNRKYIFCKKIVKYFTGKEEINFAWETPNAR